MPHGLSYMWKLYVSSKKEKVDYWLSEPKKGVEEGVIERLLVGQTYSWVGHKTPNVLSHGRIH
jgi:hypothetical protein